MSNQDTYNKPNVIKSYVSPRALLKAEQKILDIYATEIAKSCFLDIGVGGGRTSAHLANRCSRYVGVDYSLGMVEACKNRFPSLEFYCYDATDLHAFDNNSFNFALFSFNGIDCVDLESRVQILSEVNRVLHVGAKFVFSFHNSLSLLNLYKYHIPKNPLHWLREYRRVKLLNKYNGPAVTYIGREVFMLKDGAEGFEAEVLYIHPLLQVELLRRQGFDVVGAWDGTTGHMIALQDLGKQTCFWIYLVCEKLPSKI